ncbi:MAG TPA: molybdopterin converting factor subunit 1 [Polyangiaceae bacterium]|nr:molybdopterin converting factor subunit 1 [Polyangiaceae bacterium]
MTRVRVLYFAAVREFMGVAEEELELPSNVMRVADLIPHLEAIRPHLKGRFQSVRIAVNESFALHDEPLHDGDVIALIPPVAGG